MGQSEIEELKFGLLCVSEGKWKIYGMVTLQRASDTHLTEFG